ncbi:MAG: non-heme iron oxygenase ferredoxin subunit [Betaproteobacteria bacterium]|nr:MAG: non-heme iron oxygenase ferredoxin subunit [Betaproteobacteria bacterium]
MTTQHWTEVAVEFDISDDGTTLGVELPDREIALYRIGGEVFATDGVCTHGNARLCDGFLDGYEIACPLHQGKFDVRTGRASCAPATEDIKSYPVKIQNSRVFVRLDQYPNGS